MTLSNGGAGVACAAAVVAAVACAQQNQTRHSGEVTEAVVISVPESISGRLSEARVLLMSARPIPFAVIVEADRDHSEPVMAHEPREVRLLGLREAGLVHTGDSIAALHPIHGDERNSVLRASASGRWRPGRHVGEVVWPGDTIGVVQLPGWFLAEGTVSDAGTTPVRVGDSATVTIEHGGQSYRATVARAAQDGFGSVDVTLHYAATLDSAMLSRPAQAVVFPHDSLLVVPTDGLGNSSFGPVVFLPMGGGQFQARFVSVDPHSSLGIVVHRGLSHPELVAAGDLRLLQATVEESLKVHNPALH